MTEKYVSLCLSLNWIHLSHLTKGPNGKRSPGWVMAAAYVVNLRSRAMCSKWINIIGLNLCLDFKNTVQFMHLLKHFKDWLLINMHELIKKSTNNYVTLLPLKNGTYLNTEG